MIAPGVSEMRRFGISATAAQVVRPLKAISTIDFLADRFF